MSDDEPLGNWSPATDIAELRLIDTESGAVLATLPIKTTLEWRIDADGVFRNQNTFTFWTKAGGTPGWIEAYRKDGRKLAGGKATEGGATMSPAPAHSKAILYPGHLKLAGKGIA
jgi:hypothetical protein